jgi:hypothetical protein
MYRILTLMIILMISCSDIYAQNEVVDAKMKQYVGQSIGNVLKSWGPHQNIVEDGSGGKIFTWIDSRELAPAYLGGVPLPTSQTCSRSFFVDSNGIIYSYYFKGNCLWVKYGSRTD